MSTSIGGVGERGLGRGAAVGLGAPRRWWLAMAFSVAPTTSACVAHLGVERQVGATRLDVDRSSVGELAVKAAGSSSPVTRSGRRLAGDRLVHRLERQVELACGTRPIRLG